MKTNAVPQTVTAGQVPPYCYRLPGMSADEAAVVAVREMRISHLCDALALLWKLRRAAQSDEAERTEHQGAGRTKKNTAQAQQIAGRGELNTALTQSATESGSDPALYPSQGHSCAAIFHH